MKTIELSTGTLLVVDREDQLWSIYTTDDYKYLGHPSKITGEVWGKVVEVYSREHPVRYIDYTEPEYNYYQADLSGLSLCAAHNIQESDVLLFKPINKQP